MRWPVLGRGPILFLLVMLFACILHVPAAMVNFAAIGVLRSVKLDKEECAVPVNFWLNNALRFSTSEKAHRLIGECAMLSQDWNTAINAFTQAIELNDANDLLYLRRADAFYENGDLVSAVKDWRQANAAELLLRRGKHLTANVYLDEALTLFEVVISISPDNSEAYYWKGKVCQEIGDYENAEEAYFRAAELSPGDMDIQLALIGFLFGVRGNDDTAAVLLERAMNKWPDRVEPKILAGQYYSHREDYEQAAFWYYEAEGIAPDLSRPVLLHGQDLLAQDKPIEALREFERAESKPDGANHWVYHNMGIAYIELEQPEYALEYFEKAVLGAPRYAPFRISAAQTYELLGLWCDALSHYHAAALVDLDNQMVIEKITELSEKVECP